MDIISPNITDFISIYAWWQIYWYFHLGYWSVSWPVTSTPTSQVRLFIGVWGFFLFRCNKFIFSVLVYVMFCFFRIVQILLILSEINSVSMQLSCIFVVSVRLILGFLSAIYILSLWFLISHPPLSFLKTSFCNLSCNVLFFRRLLVSLYLYFSDSSSY